MERPFPSLLVGEGGSPRFSKSQVDALAAHDSMFAIGKRGYAVEEQPRRAAPDHDVAVLQPVTVRLVGALWAAAQKNSRQGHRHRHERRGKILLVPVLMQRT